MELHSLTSTHPRPTSKRVGRGNGSGRGTFSGRGVKGQKARTGANSNVPRTFIGGSTSLVQKLPKLKGFKSDKVKPVTVNIIRLLPHYKAGDVVTLLSLIENNIISASEAVTGVKVVGAVSKSLGFTFESDNPKLLRSKRLLA